jgi:hypothetical protein
MSADYMRAAGESGEQPQRDAATCAAPSCWSDAETVRVGDREAVLCETHRKALLGVSS